MRIASDRIAALLAIVTLAIGPLSACSQVGSPAAPATPATAEKAIPAGQSTETINVGGTKRTFHLYRPSTLGSPAPLVVMLHGGFGSGTQAETSYGWDAEADAGHFLVAYPDGLNRAWNTGGGCCGQPATDNVDDVGFISQLVTTAESQATIDTRRIYATGISNGGIMAYTLACRTTLFAAIGPDSATQLGECASPAELSVVHIHGTADTRIPYNGGKGKGVAHIDGPAVTALNATWRGIDQCNPPTLTTAGVVATSIAVCPNGRAVELITITDAGHQWPGGAAKSLLQRILGTDPPSTALNATHTIWAFFAAHPK